MAIQIDAFNFTVSGPLEKLAPAFLAQVPSLVKAAGRTAYLAGKLAELIISSGLLPEGTVQLICGSPSDLLETTFTGQDIVSLAGSASTAQRLHTQPGLVRNSVRFNAEADSLNCSILGPDAAAGTPESRSLRAAAGDRDDGQDKAEVHGDPAGVGAARG